MSAEVDELWFCGEVSAPQGLGALAPRLARLSWPVQVWRSGYDGSEVLRALDGPVHLDMDAGQGAGGGLFSGTVDADRDAALRFLAELSEALAETGMRHRIELYAWTSGPLISYLHHRWPRDAE